MQIIINAFVCISALIGSLLGAYSARKRKLPMYCRMVTIAIGCAALSRVYNIAVILCDGKLPKTFNTGVLAVIGCFMFVLSANCDEMDSLCDMSDPGNRHLRLYALAAPLVFAVCAAIVLFASSASVMLKITYAVEIVFIMLAAYYNFKHLIAHDVDLGVIKCLRWYNLLALLLELLYTAEIMLDAFGAIKAKSLVYLLMCICLAAVTPVLSSGIMKWKKPLSGLKKERKPKEQGHG